MGVHHRGEGGIGGEGREGVERGSKQGERIWSLLLLSPTLLSHLPHLVPVFLQQSGLPSCLCVLVDPAIFFSLLSSV